jgi:hypothetical protein
MMLSQHWNANISQCGSAAPTQPLPPPPPPPQAPGPKDSRSETPPPSYEECVQNSEITV